MKQIAKVLLIILPVFLIAPAGFPAPDTQTEVMTEALLKKCDAILKEAYRTITTRHYYMPKHKPKEVIRFSTEYTLNRFEEKFDPVFGRRMMKRIRQYLKENPIENIDDIAAFCRKFTEGIESKKGRRVYDLFAVGFLKALKDPFSAYITGETMTRIRKSMRGDSPASFGLGARPKEGKWIVTTIPHGYPAFDAGIQPGDILVEIDGKPLNALSESEAYQLFKAKKGQKRSFRIFRTGWNRAHEFVLEPKKRPRELIDIDVLRKNIGYIRVASFTGNASRHFLRALAELKGDGIEGLVLDLRNDPGGTVQDCIRIAQTFLENGKTITFTRPKSARMPEMRSSNRNPTKMPLVVLVNGASASASEMLSGALQANKRALIIGEQSYGKGVGQNYLTIRASRGDRVLRLTTFGYFLRDEEGREWSPDKVGVTPDIDAKPDLLKGNRFESVWKLRHTGLIEDYVTEVYQKHPKKMYNLAIDDEGKPENYPGIDGLISNAAKITQNGLTADIVRREVRAALRKFVAEKEKVSFVADPIDDAQLKVALDTVQGLMDGKFTIEDRLAYGYLKHATNPKSAAGEKPTEAKGEEKPPRPRPRPRRGKRRRDKEPLLTGETKRAA